MSCTCRQLRNTSKRSKFIKEFWHSPTVNALLVNALDYDIVPTMDFEMGHVNLQVDLDADLYRAWCTLAVQTDSSCIAAHQCLCAHQAPVMDRVANGVTGWHTDTNCQVTCKCPLCLFVHNSSICLTTVLTITLCAVCLHLDAERFCTDDRRRDCLQEG